MNQPPFFLISLFLLCAIGCNSKHSDNIEISYSIIQENNILMKYIENTDSVFEIVEDRIYQHIKQNRIPIPESPTKKYILIDRLLHLIYDSKSSEVTTVDIGNAYAISLHQAQFLNYYLLKELSKTTDTRFYKLLCEENILTDSFISAQHNFLHTHIDNADFDGSCSFVKYYNISLMVYMDRNESLKNLYFAMVDSSYHYQPKYRDLKNQLFEKEYARILKELIPQKPIYKPLHRYDETADREAILMIKQTWDNFMAKRNEISRFLSRRYKEVWNDATSRFQRSHLIVLKNEFEGLGVYGNEMAEYLLSDTCTYEELLTYPNFTTKWNEHMKEIEL